MKRKTTILFCALLFALTTTAQTATDSLKAMYNALPISLFPSQILHNQSPMYLWSFSIDSTMQWQLNTDYTGSPYLYPGLIPSKLMLRSNWLKIYSDMLFSCNNPSLIATDSILNIRDSLALLLYDVPIGAMHLNYDRILPGAVDSGYLHYDTAIKKLTLMPDTLWIQSNTKSSTNHEIVVPNRIFIAQNH